jgi:hypothetical protein
VTHVLYLGDNFDCHLWVSGRELRAKLDPSTEIRVGERVYAWVDPRDCVVMRREDPSGDLTSPNKAGEIGSRQ